MSDMEKEEESQYEWFTVCDEKNILLEKNENNLYKITFNIKTNGNEDTVLHVLKNGQLFELLSALNPDVIEKIKLDLYNKITEIKTDSDTDNVFIKTYDDGRERGLEIAIELINKII